AERAGSRRAKLALGVAHRERSERCAGWGSTHGSMSPRRASRADCSKHSPSRERAQGKPDARMHPQPRVQNEIAHELVTTGSPVHAGFPRAIGFNGLLRALPGVHDVLVTVIGAMQSIVANLTPAKGRQDHTTSPSALVPLVLRLDLRPSHPALNVRDDARRPSCRGGTRRLNARFLLFRRQNIFACTHFAAHSPLNCLMAFAFLPA